MTTDPSFPRRGVASPPPARAEEDRNFLFMGYVLLFVTVFSAGVLAFIAVIVAYVRRGAAEPVARSHYDFQIRIFWVSFVLTVLWVAAFVAAMISGLGAVWRATGGFSSTTVQFAAGDPAQLGAVAALCLLASAGFAFLTLLWLWIASAWGALRLASNGAVGQRRA